MISEDGGIQTKQTEPTTVHSKTRWIDLVESGCSDEEFECAQDDSCLHDLEHCIDAVEVNLEVMRTLAMAAQVFVHPWA